MQACSGLLRVAASRLSFLAFAFYFFPFFLSFVFLSCFVFFRLSRWSSVDVPLIIFCPADEPRKQPPMIFVGVVEAPMIEVKNTCTQVSLIPPLGVHICFYKMAGQDSAVCVLFNDVHTNKCTVYGMRRIPSAQIAGNLVFI